MQEINREDRYNLLLYLIIAFGITWSILFPLIFIYTGLNLYLREIWHSFGAIGPAIASILILYRRTDKNMTDWLKKGLSIIPKSKLILFAFFPLIIFGISIIIEILLGISNIPDVLKENNILDGFDLFILFLPSLSYGFFEELGWRGYLLPKLQKYLNALKSTFILTIIWYLWHLPMFFYRFDLFFALFFMFPLLLSGSIVFTFLFNESKGSLLMVIILHLSYDIVSSKGFSTLAIILVSAFFIMMDIRAIKVFGTESLSQEEKIVI